MEQLTAIDSVPPLRCSFGKLLTGYGLGDIGGNRAESYGLYSMQMQGAITIFAANIKRILKLI